MQTAKQHYTAAHSQHFTLEGHRGSRCQRHRGGKDWEAGRDWGRQRIFGISEAHRTLLVKRTVLLYWIMSQKSQFFSVKNPLNQRLRGVAAVAPLAAPLLNCTVMREIDGTMTRDTVSSTLGHSDSDTQRHMRTH